MSIKKGINNKVSDLDKSFLPSVELLLKRLDEIKLSYKVYETLRSKEVQEAYYAQGRETTIEVNKKRNKAGLWAITDQENLNKITWTLKSKHIEGKAIDIIYVNEKGTATWNAPESFWQTLASEAKNLGLDAGYYWSPNRDSPHIQVKE